MMQSKPSAPVQAPDQTKAPHQLRTGLIAGIYINPHPKANPPTTKKPAG